MLITQKICTLRIFHLHCSIIRGIICCEYIHVGDSVNGGLFQGGWILFDYIENIHLYYISVENYFKEVMLDGTIIFHGGRILCEYI